MEGTSVVNPTFVEVVTGLIHTSYRMLCVPFKFRFLQCPRVIIAFIVLRQMNEIQEIALYAWQDILKFLYISKIAISPFSHFLFSLLPVFFSHHCCFLISSTFFFSPLFLFYLYLPLFSSFQIQKIELLFFFGQFDKLTLSHVQSYN